MFFLNHPNIADIKARDLYSPRSSWTASTIIAGVVAVALFAVSHILLMLRNLDLGGAGALCLCRYYGASSTGRALRRVHHEPQ
jgi:hypothetical protein